MRLFIDSSAFAKRYVLEEGSDMLERLLQKTTNLAVCVILIPEIISALNRKIREGVLLLPDYRKAKRKLIDDVRDATVIQITPAVISLSVKILENNILRAMDALHVACALEWQAELFVTADKKQFKAAQNSGLLTEYIGNTLSIKFQ